MYGQGQKGSRTMKEMEREDDCCSPPFPEDFGQRLERLIELAGPSRDEFTQRLAGPWQGHFRGNYGVSIPGHSVRPPRKTECPGGLVTYKLCWKLIIGSDSRCEDSIAKLITADFAEVWDDREA